jgi:TP901 family phage tail tape measure protein
LERQVVGNTAADRQFRAELIRNQSIASNRVDVADSQRNSAIASQRAGTSAAIAGGAAAVALPAIGLGTSAVNITAGFDDQMSAVAAVLSAQDRTSENMLKLREQAKSIGASTKFSATDAASGLVLLAQSGQTVEEQLKSIAGTTLLAAAGGLDLAAATDITVSSLGQFGLKASDAVHVANVLAYNAGAANLDVASLGESLRYAGPAASKFGASFEETNAILDVLSESGIRASSAGTALRTMFINLASPSSQAQSMMDQYGISVKDASGNMLSTVDVMAQLQSKLSGLASGDQLDVVSTIFGKEATPAALSIVNGGADKMKAYLKGGQDADTVKGANGAVGSAAVQAGIMEDNIGGSFRNLSSAIEGVQIEMGEVLVPAIRLVTNTLSSLLTRFIELPKPIKTAITVTAALVTGIAAITAVVASGAAVFFTLQSAIGASAIAATLMSSTLIPLTGFANAAIASFGAAGFAGSIGVLSGALTTVGAGIFASITSPFALATAGILALYAGLELLTPGFNVLGSVLSVIGAPFAVVFGFVKGVAESVASALVPVLGELGKFQTVAGPIGEAFAIAAQSLNHFAGAGEMVGKIVGGAIGIGLVVPMKALIGLIDLAVNSTVTLGQFGSMLAAPFINSAQFIRGAWQGFIDWFLQMPLVQFA